MQGLAVEATPAKDHGRTDSGGPPGVGFHLRSTIYEFEELITLGQRCGLEMQRYPLSQGWNNG